MFIVLLKFSKNRDKARDFMEGHSKWIKQGLDDGIFLLVGSIKPGIGGTVIAHNTSKADLISRVEQDPFVAEKVFEAEILEIEASKMDPRLEFLLEN